MEVERSEVRLMNEPSLRNTARLHKHKENPYDFPSSETRCRKYRSGEAAFHRGNIVPPGTSPNGLTQEEAAKRLAQYGPNQIDDEKTNFFLKFLSYFWGPIPWMIDFPSAAVVLSAVVRHWLDFVIISVLLLSNAVVGFWEERQAGNAIAALKAKLAIKARVKRDARVKRREMD